MNLCCSTIRWSNCLIPARYRKMLKLELAAFESARKRGGGRQPDPTRNNKGEKGSSMGEFMQQFHAPHCREGCEIPLGYGGGGCMALTPQKVGTFVGFGGPKWQFSKSPHTPVYNMGGVPGHLQPNYAPGTGAFYGFWRSKFKVPTYLCGGALHWPLLSAIDKLST